MNDYIPVNEPIFLGNEKKYLNECIESGWVSSEGRFVTMFEKQFGDFLGLMPGISVCNGTAALETALYALGVGKNDEVIMPSFTIISCALAALRLGAKPVLVDIDPETWCMDVEQIESKVTSKSKVIMPVHIYGHPVDMDPVLRVANKFNLKVLEDAAEAHGAEYNSQQNERWIKCGGMGHASIFSFYANKIITSGEGGMVLSREAKVLKRASDYRNLCFKKERRFYHTQLGYNYRMTNLQAAVGLAQLERIEKLLAIKNEFGNDYQQRLDVIPGIRFQARKPWAKPVYWMYCVELDPKTGLTAQKVMNRLGNMKIGTRPFFIGLHAQPALKDLGLFHSEHYPNTDHAHRYGFYLPSGMTLNKKKIDRVCDALSSIIR